MPNGQAGEGSVPGDPGRDAAVRAWRLAQVDRCVAAESDLEADAEVLDATRSPEELAGHIAAGVGGGRGAGGA